MRTRLPVSDRLFIGFVPQVFMIIYQLVSLSLGASTFAYGLYYTVGGLS